MGQLTRSESPPLLVHLALPVLQPRIRRRSFGSLLLLLLGWTWLFNNGHTLGKCDRDYEGISRGGAKALASPILVIRQADEPATKTGWLLADFIEVSSFTEIAITGGYNDGVELRIRPVCEEITGKSTA